MLELVTMQCNLCNTSTGFACFRFVSTLINLCRFLNISMNISYIFSETQFFKCNVSTGIIDIVQLFTCPSGYYCDDSLTGSPCLASGTASCTLPEFPVTQNFNATIFCSSKAVGRYSLPSDATCKKYVNCFLNGTILGSIYTCP